MENVALRSPRVSEAVSLLPTLKSLTQPHTKIALDARPGCSVLM